MQTHFSEAQLRDPAVAEADSILRRCVHCGLCTATCPTYVVLGDERDSPRGRIYAIKDMLERGIDAGDNIGRHIDRCLSCFSCMTTCPSGVDYMHLVEIGRNHIEKTARRPWRKRMSRKLLAAIVPYPSRFRTALRLAPVGRALSPWLRRLGFADLAAMAALAPERRLSTARFSGPGTATTDVERSGRVILLAGCAQQVLRPEINDATIRLLARRGVDVTVAAGAGCCGALVQHIGMEADAIAAAKRNVDAWSKEIDRGGVTAIVINASGCGTTVKDYGHLLAGEPDYRDRAQRISELAMDISEFLASHDIGTPERWSSVKVAYHAACSLQHGQRVTHQPRQLLKTSGYTLVDIAEGHLCCGSAGVYNILEPEISAKLRDRKAGHIKAVRPDVVATGNIGCLTQLQSALDIPVVHTVELIDWAYGGPAPSGLEQLKPFSTAMPKPARQISDYIGA